VAITVRAATEEDAIDMATVIVRSWQVAYRNIIPDEFLDGLSIEKRAERMLRDSKEYKGTSFYFVAENEGKVVGSMLLSACRDEDKSAAKAGEIIAMYLFRECWDRGFGRCMMDYSIAFFERMECREIVLWVLEENYRARRFYEKSGFEFDGTRQVLELGKPLSAIRYTRKLPEPSR